MTQFIFTRPDLPDFLRGDCNDDGTVDISDAIFSLGSLFLGEMIRTGPRTGQATLVAAATDEGQEIVYTMVVSGTVELTGPDRGQATAILGVFGPSQDPFGEDPPEYGCYPYGYTLQRMPVSPPCGL